MEEARCQEGIQGHLGSLLHLRYLRLAYTDITELPREVRYLKFLQTLHLSGYECREELPEEMGLLTQLVCLHVDTGILGGEIKIPAGLIGKLTSLQELTIGTPRDDDLAMEFVKELGMLRELRVLRTSNIHARDERMKRALLESLGNLHNIRHLQIGIPWVTTLTRQHPAAGLEVSSRHLQFLLLDCIVFSELSSWMKPSLAPSLLCLVLQVLVVKEQDMEILARLPELRHLKLYSCDETKLVSLKIGTQGGGAGYFRKLRFLGIFGQTTWFDLRGCECNSGAAASSIMPSLESVQFQVQVLLLVKDDAALLSFDRQLLGFENLGRSSLRSVKVNVHCEGAFPMEVEKVEAALERASAGHPKSPTLKITRKLENYMVFLSLYQKGKSVEALHIPDPAESPSKVIRLLYTNIGVALLALRSSAVHNLWKWSDGQSTASDPPQLWQPENGTVMTNNIIGANTEEATACIALSKNDSHLISASGGQVSLFNIMTFGIMTTFMAPPPAATFLIFYPQDNNIIAIGMDDSSILIYNVRTDEVQKVLMGHQKKITGLTFSQPLNVLVSSGADAQLCVWSSIDGWEKGKSSYIRSPSDHTGALVGDTMVQFHNDQKHLLVVHESQLAIYDGKQLECLHSWSPRDELSSPICSAVYSSDCVLVYAVFCDGAIGIFEARSLRLGHRIAPSDYMPSSISSGGEIVYPMVVAAHPRQPYQIAVGMSDGAVHVLEPGEECWSENEDWDYLVSGAN